MRVKWSWDLLENTGINLSIKSGVIVLPMISIRGLVVAAHLIKKFPRGEVAAAGITALTPKESTRSAQWLILLVSVAI
jgi:hypothetical protein